ncbi:hypothetical protein MNB_SV-5-910 [hydrothermal vent metagenome]|uniref:Uncharacterized protein n=1 Tax=hydrothermal vent metagenome TaxID=652676 RepID=A0A1W1EG39_9ZZZZ
MKEIYGAGILFFYYVKYIIVIGWPILIFGLDYKPNIIMDLLWVYSFALITKDFILKVVFKKRYCDINQNSSCKKDK